jgi:large subunit ribosomal protein L29
MKAEELTVLEGQELADRLRQSRRELYELRFQLAVGQLENHRQVRKVKKDIARILTVIRSRELAEVEVPVAVSSPLAGEVAPQRGDAGAGQDPATDAEEKAAEPARGDDEGVAEVEE